MVLPAGELPFSVTFERADGAGIAVLRYDDRGVGGSTGSVARSTTSDFAHDALAGIARLLERADIDPGRIGLVGHSEGAAVASLAASRSDAVGFAVLLAGTSVPGAEVMYEQSAAIARAAGASEEQIAWTADFQPRLFAAMEASEDLEPYREELGVAIRNGLDRLSEAQRAPISDVDGYVQTRIDQQINALQTPWFRHFLSFDPAEALRQTRVPVLALFGGLDLQVIAVQNRGPMAEALLDNPDVTIEVLPRANHLFQTASHRRRMDLHTTSVRQFPRQQLRAPPRAQISLLSRNQPIGLRCHNHRSPLAAFDRQLRALYRSVTFPAEIEA